VEDELRPAGAPLLDLLRLLRAIFLLAAETAVDGKDATDDDDGCQDRNEIRVFTFSPAHSVFTHEEWCPVPENFTATRTKRTRRRTFPGDCVVDNVVRMQAFAGPLKKLLPMAALIVALGCVACSPLYVVRAGIQEARILSSRRPIARVVEDPSTTAETRRKLDLVLQARAYASHRLDLDAGDSYTTFAPVAHDTLLMVISASAPDRFAPYTWWFPIVGRVPYKGFFEFERAWDEAARLDARGFDTYVRPSGAFSTLGFFNDPLLSTLLRYGDVALASTVIHEILHNSIYIPSQVAFNESFASFVGDRGAIDFFCNRDGPDSDTCDLARRSWHDTLLYGAFLSDLVHRLEAIYAQTDVARDRLLDQKAAVIADARERFTSDVEPLLQTTGYRGFARRPVNNATLIGVRLYYERLDLFERVYEAFGGDLPGVTQAIMDAARSQPADPYAAVERLVQGRPVQ
jgi:predicted aminopeptidase